MGEESDAGRVRGPGLAACWLVAAALLAAAGCVAPQRDLESPILERSAQAVGLELDLLAGPVPRPTAVVDTGDDRARLLIASQFGRISSWAPGLGLAPFLDISEQVECCDHKGLFGLALHPRYRDNGRLFVYFTDRDGDARLVEYRRPAAANRADPASARGILRLPRPGPANPGGRLGFGPDGMLYVAIGDGGRGSARDPALLAGKILRLDLDRGAPYAIPQDNPWVGRAGARGEVWASGLRDPGQFSFDRAGGDLFVADSDLDGVEAINRQSFAQGGMDYGWPATAGSRCRQGAVCPDALVRPILEYDRQVGCGVIGGFVYRGGIAALQGHYLFADHCTGWVFAARRQPGGWQYEVLLHTRLNPTAFGQGRDGEVLLLDINGGLFRLTD